MTHAVARTECEKDPGIFGIAELAVGKHIDRKRDLWSPDIDAAAEIRAVLGWCAHCVVKANCLDEMSNAGYTGIAGGEFLHKGVIQEPEDDK
ncbi:hypothetical protein [Mycolicibacterium llatzerense]|uniref:hypothetical protein n=1 Tax=Mycolicibacterium llatzerense TaxID=280871 RepID=UPI0008DCA755|nr:hypothetical protein [Mycolicibacterium llatzerense]